MLVGKREGLIRSSYCFSLVFKVLSARSQCKNMPYVLIKYAPLAIFPGYILAESAMPADQFWSYSTDKGFILMLG